MNNVRQTDEAAGTEEEQNASAWNRFVNRITKHKPSHGKHRYIFPQNAADDESLGEHELKIIEEQRHYLKNDIRTTKYTILSFLPKNLFEQFHRFANCYFVFIILLNFVPAIGAIEPFLSMAPVITILIIQAIKDLIEDYGRYKSDRMVNYEKAEVYQRCRNILTMQRGLSML